MMMLIPQYAVRFQTSSGDTAQLRCSRDNLPTLVEILAGSACMNIMIDEERIGNFAPIVEPESVDDSA